MHTVISMKMEVLPDIFEKDPNGFTLATEINKYLPGSFFTFQTA